MKKASARPFPFWILLLLLPAAAALLFLLFGKPKAQREDYRLIASRTYDAAFLSMYPTHSYSEEDFQYYLGLNVFRASYCIPGLSVMEEYLEKIAASGNAVSTVYLGIRPDKTDLSDLHALTARYPSVNFEIILSYPSLDYWTGLSERAYRRVLSDYAAFLSGTLDIPNAHLFFLGHLEWLVANPGCYEDMWTVNKSIAKTILLESTILGEHFVTGENADSFYAALEALTRQARTAPEHFPDLSDYKFIFFGDSVIGNYTDGMSVPGVVKGLSGAAVYNCGYGGNSAALGPETDISLPGITEAFFAGDLSAVPEDKQIYQGFLSCFQNPPAGKRICYVISYGLNDYLEGYPVSSDDPFDITTYTGAIRTAVATIRENDGDACILLCTPSWSGYTLKESQEPGAVHLQTYADAALSLAEELQVIAVDNYYTLGIDSSNYTEYLSDLIHPNEQGRYLIALKIMEAIP